MSIVKLNNKAVSNATAFGSISSLGSMVFIKKLTASGSSTLSFLNGSDGVVLDDTYKEYVFTFNNIHPSANAKSLTFQTDTGTNTNYNIACTTTAIKAYHNEGDSETELGYDTQYDAAQSTSFINLAEEIMSNNDSSVSGTLTIFNPNSDTFVKHFMSDMNGMRNDVYSWRFMKAGYFNTSTALTRFQFKLNSGNIDSGDICLYGIA
tara:strand:- start:84 stop:704 length:621 start_codon:yes stop_codon:yes gene_type:complete